MSIDMQLYFLVRYIQTLMISKYEGIFYRLVYWNKYINYRLWQSYSKQFYLLFCKTLNITAPPTDTMTTTPKTVRDMNKIFVSLKIE